MPGVPVEADAGNRLMETENVLGLIAGGGRLPFIVAAGARKAGLKVVCVGLADACEPELSACVDVFHWAALARPGSWIRKLKRHGVSRTIMVGRVAKARLYTPRRILHYLPDWRAFRIWYWRLRGKDKLDNIVLSAIADELKTGGIILENSTMYCREHLAAEGFMGKCRAPASARQDIEFGWQRAKKLTELDIGQAIAVKERQVIAVEAMEGTAAMIERAGRLCPSGRWTLIKVARPQQDERFDVPCVGPDTIRALASNSAACLVVEAEKIIILDKPQTIELADRLGIALLGIKSPPQQPLIES